MYRCSLIVIASLAVLLSGCQLPGGEPSGAKEGYFTWVDEQGQVRQTRIPDAGDSSGEDAPSDSPLGKSGSAGNDSSASNSQDSSDSRHEEFNLENYPDGNALAEQGFLRPGDPEPYFTWRDAQGNVRVSYYQPDTRSAVEKGEIESPLKLTKASIYQASSAPVDASLPEGADPLASAVLGLDGTVAPYFERWRTACCETLERSDHIVWDMGREFGVNVKTTSPRHDFITGSSRYRLVSLPQPPVNGQSGQDQDRPVAKDFILRLRSFDQKGVFVPSVAFLDDEFRPVRLVTDLVAEFIPESWSRHGYLRSYIPVFPSRGERWMLIYTRDQDLGEQTVIQTRFGPRAIPHQPTGELGLARVEQ